MRRVCTKCGNSFTPSRNDENSPETNKQKYCSYPCKKAGLREPSKYSQMGIPTGTVGAMAELIVSIDLMKKGFSVFRAMSPACNFDLVALKDEILYSFEVRTGYRNKVNNTVNYPKKKEDKAQYYSVVLHQENDAVHYFPELFL